MGSPQGSLKSRRAWCDSSISTNSIELVAVIALPLSVMISGGIISGFSFNDWIIVETIISAY